MLDNNYMKSWCNILELRYLCNFVPLKVVLFGLVPSCILSLYPYLNLQTNVLWIN